MLPSEITFRSVEDVLVLLYFNLIKWSLPKTHYFYGCSCLFYIMTCINCDMVSILYNKSIYHSLLAYYDCLSCHNLIAVWFFRDYQERL